MKSNLETFKVEPDLEVLCDGKKVSQQLSFF